MERILTFVAITLTLVVANNARLLFSPMLPPIIETAKYNHSYTESLNYTTEYIFVYNKTNVIFFSFPFGAIHKLRISKIYSYFINGSFKNNFAL